MLSSLAWISPWTGTCHTSVLRFCFVLLCFVLCWWVCFWLVFGFVWWWLRDGQLDYTQVLYQFTLEASQSGDGHVYALINPCNLICNSNWTCWTTWRKPWRRWTEKMFCVFWHGGGTLPLCPVANHVCVWFCVGPWPLSFVVSLLLSVAKRKSGSEICGSSVVFRRFLFLVTCWFAFV